MLVTTIFSGETTPIELASMSASAVGVACIPYVFARSFDMIFERQAGEGESVEEDRASITGIDLLSNAVEVLCNPRGRPPMARI